MTNNPCRCPKKTKGFIEKGYLNPLELKWHADFSSRIFELSENTVDDLLNERDKIYSNLFKQYPFKTNKVTTEASLVYQADGSANSSFDLLIISKHETITLALKTKAFLVIFLLTFVSMIAGIILFNWWCVEMSALFLGSAILIALLSGWMKNLLFMNLQKEWNPCLPLLSSLVWLVVLLLY